MIISISLFISEKSEEMVILRNQTGHSYCNSLLSELGSQGLSEFDDFVTLVSGEETNFVHRSILSRVSPFLHDIVFSSCYCLGNVLILPPSPPSTLASIVALIYNGTISGIAMNNADQIMVMARLFGIEIKGDIVKLQAVLSNFHETNVINEQRGWEPVFIFSHT